MEWNEKGYVVMPSYIALNKMLEHNVIIAYRD